MNSPQTHNTNMPELVVWKTVFEDGFCVCTTLQGYEDGHKLKRGTPSGTDFPADAYFPMDPEFPDDLKLGDSIKNSGGYLLVSQRLKEALERGVADAIEYLPVRIINHKGRLASADYFIANPLAVYDAIDVEKSTLKWNHINPDAITSISKLVLDGNRIPPKASMFRLKAFERRVVLSGALADSLASRGFVGLGFTNVAEFRGF